MTIAFPVTNLLDLYPLSPEGYNFRLGYRQEQSRQANGVTTVKDLGTPLWWLDAATVPLLHRFALDFEAVLASLDGGIGTFLAWDARRKFPLSHPSGDFSDTANIASLGANNKSLSLTGLPSGFQLSRGDYLSFQSGGWASLHQVMEPVTASGGGTTVVFEVRPHLWPGTTTGLSVKLKKPSTIMSLVPGSIQKNQVDALRTTISFQAYQRP